MLPVTIPSTAQLSELTENRDDASVSIYLPSSPLPSENQAVRLALKNAARRAGSLLEEQGADKVVIDRIVGRIAGLDDDPEFWQHQSTGLGVLVSPDRLHAFRLLEQVPETVAVNDRFRIGPLLRSLGSANAGYVLAVTEGEVSFYGIAAGSQPTTLELDLPLDLHSVLERAENSGQADRGRATGSHGQKIEQQRYCRQIQDALLERIGDNRLPLILAASAELGPSYRSINTYQHLLPEGIEGHPESLSRDELDSRAGAILEQHYRADLASWRELFAPGEARAWRRAGWKKWRKRQRRPPLRPCTSTSTGSPKAPSMSRARSQNRMALGPDIRWSTSWPLGCSALVAPRSRCTMRTSSTGHRSQPS
jgi:Bacterial archaeo-eukaryotic release factor family 11